MFGISIDDRPDAPVGKPSTRRAVAIHWDWTTEYSRGEMAQALGVTERTIDNYLADGPTEDVKRLMDGVESEVRLIAVAELKDQLRRAGSASRSAEKPVKVWTDEDGDLQVNDKTDDDTGELTGKYPVPADMEMGPDETARFYRREEVRDILDQLATMTGAAEPKQVEVSGEGLQVVSNVVEITEDDV